MYYEQHTDKYQDVPEFYYKQEWGPDGHQHLVRCDNTRHFVSSMKRVYSFRTKRPKNDSSTAIVPGDSLVSKRPVAITGVGSYLSSYKEAIQSLNDEAGQVSGNSGYGAFDKGHSFASLNVHAKVATLKGTSLFTLSEPGRPVRQMPFVSAVQVCPQPEYHAPGQVSGYPTEVKNTIQELAASTVPDKIQGSLGQDIVDLAELPKLIGHLASIGRDLVKFQRSWRRLTVKVRHAIDTCIRHRGTAPKWALKTAGSGYLEWMFVLQPYIEDMQAIMDFLSSTSSKLLKRYSFTKTKTALKTSKRAKGGAYSGGCRSLTYDHIEEITYSVHLAISWVHRGPLPSDESFAKKAIEINRRLGIWYPSLLWDLMPWTWLIDWCTHIGSSIEGMYAISNSEYRPAYAWATVRNSVRYFGSFVPYFPNDTLIGPNFFGVENHSLCRVPVQVNGLLMPSFSRLSTSQKAILSSLGLSHIK